MALELINKTKPYLIVTSPICDPFSPIQGLNYPKWDPKRVEANMERGRLHLTFAM